ncbi:MAG: ubiquinol oxidase subunit II [Chlamydiales bacterium]|nr:ubiquinol oxidase subunit II [Chlamydiales bacterium]
MQKKFKFTLLLVFVVGSLLWGMWLLYESKLAVLDPKGAIADAERSLFFTATWLMLIVVIPVFVLTIYIIWKYRASNKKATYSPDWDKSHLIESIWWGVPLVIVIALGVITWKSCIELDPFRPLVHENKPLRIQVVALQWKWLFIYPDQNIATVNFVHFPEKTPLNFEITADAPMNSFWIPQLGSQIYAMPGMDSRLHLIASEPGTFRGSSANLSGRGFAGMTFTAKASTQEEFDQWVASAKASQKVLTFDEYTQLVEPSENNPVASYSLKEEDLYQRIIMKYVK